ncbi:AsmA family protein [Mucilaginibacter paludis]|uniref:AsmA family protein n=1 Tax=Mucilaginibacter paludis DSM 18603 TaxID=714943 RepID=H1Y5J0_9SPHI|nr:AsmA family protein [Mucilaginibacter paludis]EHQ29342.1 AsmA family protein [Mucilaginibacter paludis DSM 18603]
MPGWLKIVLKVFASLVVVILILVIAAMLYINSNKKKVLTLVTTELNKNLDGKLTIGTMESSFFKSFPGVSLSLHNVLLRDNRWPEHHHTLLDAKNFDVSVNTAALLRGTISINHIDISNAAIDLYTDSSGYSNTSVFKKNKQPKKANDGDANSSAELHQFNLKDVGFAVNDQKANKLFQFTIHQLNGKMTYPDSGWHAAVHLDVLANSMAFNKANGSFIKNKTVEGDLVAGYNEDSGKINVSSDRFNIGGNLFKLKALFVTGKRPAQFSIKLAANQITWRGASALLSANISKTLNMFNLGKPFDVKATIAGDFEGGGSPYLNVTATVRNNTLTMPGGNIEACNFDGLYTNNNVPSQGFTDENSVIRLLHLTGVYNNLPFKVDTCNIINLAKPIATGNFTSNFPLTNLNELLGSKVAKFTRGSANMNLRYKADIVDYRLNKPMITGVIDLKDADISYIPRNLNLKNTSISLHFTGDNLILNNIRVQSGKSIVLMEGRVNNFLNLYYSAPEKILLTWQITSPQLYLGEFLGFLNSRKHAPVKNQANSGNIIDQLSNVLDKGKADMHMRIAKLYYKNFLATDATADLLLSEDGVALNNVSVKHAGGTLKLNGQIIQDEKANRFLLSTVVSNVNIHEFFYAFDNFGLTDITYNNLKGFLSAKAMVNGGLSNTGSVVPRSISGNVSINLRNGALINYNPLKTVGKFAFPFRNLNDIEIPKLDAKFDIRGDKIIISPMQITSSVLNADIAGTYGLTNGTNIALDIPLRNPKNDTAITDKAELLKKRYKGIVLHILAKDDDKGKIKIGWNKDHK